MSLYGEAEEERNLAVGEMMIVIAAKAETQCLGEKNAGIIGRGNLKQNLSQSIFARPNARDVNKARSKTAASVNSVDNDVLQEGDLTCFINAHGDEAKDMIGALVLHDDETILSPQRQFKLLRISNMS